jgi:hypothetical protein
MPNLLMLNLLTTKVLPNRWWFVLLPQVKALQSSCNNLTSN